MISTEWFSFDKNDLMVITESSQIKRISWLNSDMKDIITDQIVLIIIL